jgi:hypothetical protein
MFGGEVEGFESVEGTFLEWATSDHFRLGLAKEYGFEDVEFGAGQQAGSGVSDDDDDVVL